jgi:hypothetical protein
MILVSGEPMMMQVAMSALASTSASKNPMRSSGRPAARPKITGGSQYRGQAFEGAAKLPGARWLIGL